MSKRARGIVIVTDGYDVQELRQQLRQVTQEVTVRDEKVPDQAGLWALLPAVAELVIPLDLVAHMVGELLRHVEMATAAHTLSSVLLDILHRTKYKHWRT